jgi:hypothetical protein
MMEILRLMNNIYRAQAIAIYDTVAYNKALAPLFQLLFNHCSSPSLGDRNGVTKAFLDGCPPWMVAVTKNKHPHKLTNRYLLGRMEEKLDLCERLPRKAKRKMDKWWLYRMVKRRSSFGDDNKA